VRKIRVLLANHPQMMREVLTEMIRRQEDIDLVGEVLEPLDVLVAVREMRADAVVLALEECEEPGLCSHLLAEYPDLTILGLAPDGKTAFVRSPRREIGQPSEEAILRALRGNHRDVG
jgi:DNA-binding NarL/FixJ family response regulator